MKKFDFKKVLILMLSFVMIFALAACSGGSDSTPTKKAGPKGEKMTAGKFVNTLLTSVKPAFQNEIGENDDIVLDLAFDAGMGLKGTEDYATVENEALKLSAQVYYNRPVPDKIVDGKQLYKKNKSAIKVEVKDSEGDALLLVTYSLDTPDCVYIKAGENKTRFEFGIDSDGTNNSFSQVFCEMMMKELSFLNGNSIDSIISAVTTQFGQNVDINKIVNEILPLVLNKSFDELLEIIPSEFASLKKDFQKAGVKGLLTGDLAGMIFTGTTETKATDGFSYSANLNTRIFKTLASALFSSNAQLKKDFVAVVDRLTAKFDLQLDKNKNFKGLVIDVKKTNLAGKLGEATARLTFNGLNIAKGESFVSASAMKSQYLAENCEVNVDATLSVDKVINVALKDTYNAGITNYLVDDFALDQTTADAVLAKLNSFTSDAKNLQGLGGKINVKACGSLDLKKNDSKTYAKANIYYNDELIATVNFDFTADSEAAVIEGVARPNKVGTLTVKFVEGNDEVNAVRNYGCAAIMAALTAANKSETRATLKAQNKVGINALAQGIINDTNCIVVKNLEVQSLIWDMLVIKDKRDAESETKDTLIFSSYNWEAAALATKGVEGKKNSWDADQNYAARFYKEKSPINNFRLVFKVSEVIKHAYNTLTGDYNNMVKTAEGNDKKIDLITFAVENLYDYFIYNSDDKFEESVLNASNLKNDEDFFAYFLKESDTAVFDLTNAGLLPLVKAVKNTNGNGDYILNTKKHKLEEFDSDEDYDSDKYAGRYDLVYSDTMPTFEYDVKVDGQLVCDAVLNEDGQYVAKDFTSGNWFYMNDNLITVDQARKVYKIATSDENTTETIKAIDGKTDIAIKPLRKHFYNIYAVEMFESSSVFSNVNMANFVPQLANGNLSGYLGRFFVGNTDEQILKAGVLYNLNGKEAKLDITANFLFKGVDSQFGKFVLENIDVAENDTTEIDMAKYFDAVRYDYKYYNCTYVVKDANTDKWVVADKNDEGAALIKDTELIYLGWAGNIYANANDENPINNWDLK